MPPRKRAGVAARKAARAKRVPLRKITPSRRPPLPPHFNRRTGQIGRPPKFYTAEFLVEARRRVEQTSQSTTAIAGNFGMHHSVLARLIEREGWVRPESSGRRRGLSPVMRLAAAADALVQEAGAPIGHGHPTPDGRSLSSGRPSAGPVGPSDPPPPGEGGTARAAPAPHDAIMAADTSVIDRLEAAVLKELATVETMRASLGAEPLRPMDAERTARTLSTLTETLAKLRRLRLGARPQSDLTDDILDIDAFRLDLARRIDLFVASRTDAGHGDGDPGAVAVGEAG
jgi:hypothetical protein